MLGPAPLDDDQPAPLLTGSDSSPLLLLAEPFACASHSVLGAFLRAALSLPPSCATVVAAELPGRKWAWALRAGALWAATALPPLPAARAPHTTLVVSSMLNLAELLGLRPDLAAARRKCVYFHEQQLSYPRRWVAEPAAQRRAARAQQHDGPAEDGGGGGGSRAPVEEAAPPDPAAPAPGLTASSCGAGKRARPLLPVDGGGSGAALPRHGSGGDGDVAALLHAAIAAAAAEPALAMLPTSSSSSSGSSSSSSAAASTADEQGPRDFAFGWAQLVSALAADAVLFNSAFTRDSFLGALPRLLATVPAGALRAPGAPLQRALAAKAVVLYLPVSLPPPPPPLHAPAAPASAASRSLPPPLAIAWPHRWEHDKGPDALFAALRALASAGAPFRLVLLGEAFAEAPPCFAANRPWLAAAGAIAHWGRAPDRAAYAAALRGADVVLSTARHEFFGVAVVEGVLAGCYPLCPGALAYPEVLAPLPASQPDGGAAAGAAGAAVPGAGAAMQALAAAMAAERAAAARGGHASPRQQTPLEERIDCRGSPHLYKSAADLHSKLLALARQPEAVRAWRRRQPQPPQQQEQQQAAAAARPAGEAAAEAVARSDGAHDPRDATRRLPPSDFALERFDPAALAPHYARVLLGLPTATAEA